MRWIGRSGLKVYYHHFISPKQQAVDAPQRPIGINHLPLGLYALPFTGHKQGSDLSLF
jgi:hypothetical protein